MHTTITVQTGHDFSGLALNDAKAHLRVDHVHEDDLITGLIKASTAFVEDLAGISLLPTTLKATVASFGDGVELRRGPIKVISSVQYFDLDGTLQTLGGSAWHSPESDRNRRWVLPAPEQSWPSHQTRCDAIQVLYQAGYADADSIPEPVKHALRLLVGHWYTNRGPVNIGNITSDLSFTVEALLSPFTDLVLG